MSKLLIASKNSIKYFISKCTDFVYLQRWKIATQHPCKLLNKQKRKEEIIVSLDEDARKKILDYLHPPLIEKPVNQKPSLHQMEHYQKFYENGEYVRAVESTTEQNYNMIDGCANNLPKPRIINGRESVLDKLRIRQMAREKQKSGQMQEQSTDIERNRK